MLTRGLPVEPRPDACGGLSGLGRFLANDPRHLEPDEAGQLLAHAASCEACATLLSERPAHAELLLELTHPPAEPSPEVKRAVETAQAEVRTIGNALLDRLTPEVRNRLRAPLPRERRRELWTLDPHVAEPEFRAALAVSEAALALQAIMATVWDGDVEAVASAEEVVVNGAKHVPASYVSARIAEHADTDVDTALTLWRTLVDLLAAGKTGLPGLHVSRWQDSRVVLMPAELQSAVAPPAASGGFPLVTWSSPIAVERPRELPAEEGLSS